MNTLLSTKVGFLLLFCFATSGWALDPSRHITQYGHTAWRNRDGYFSSAPSAVAQTKDGYIWIGTIAGLLRFDGVRFTPWAPPAGGQTLPTATIVSLAASKDGSLWIGTSLGLARWSSGTLTNYSNALGHINSILEDHEGHVWIARTRVKDGKGPLCEVVGPKLRCYGQADGIGEAQAQALALDSSGRFWIGSNGALTQWTPKSAQTFHPSSGERSIRAAAQALAVGQDGGLWVGFFGSGHGLGLQRFEKGAWQPLTIGAFDGTSIGISSLLIDGANSLWVGTDSEGIYRIRPNSVEHFDTSGGLSGDHVQAFFEDEEHNVWVITTAGIDCFRDPPLVSYTKLEGLTADHAQSVYAAEDGTVWVGNVEGLDSIRDGVVSSIRTHHGLPGSKVTAMLVDHTGHLWVGVDNSLYLHEQGSFRPIVDANGKRSDLVTQLAEDVDGSIWAAEQGPIHRLLHIRGHVIAEQFPMEKIRGVVADPHGGVWLNLGDAIAHKQMNDVQQLLKMPPGIHVDYISDMALDHQGALWVAIRQGVLRFDRENTQLLGGNNGLPCASHGHLVFDGQGSLWLTQRCGIVRIERDSLQNWTLHPEAKVSALLLDVFDGAQIGYSDFQPVASLGRDGWLWFANGSVLQTLDPANLHINSLPPPVHIEQLIADHKDMAVAPAVRLAPLTRDIEIDYTALSYQAPQKVRFRYKLEGHDAGWEDPGPRRQAFYTDLRPGKYRFRVIASNNDGIWNEQGATLDFTIAPAWYQTSSFVVLCIASGILILWLLYQARMRQIASSISARFDERLAERTRLARELHDTLLQTLQGSKLAADGSIDGPADPVRMRETMEQLSGWLGQAMRELRAALNSLRTSTTQKNDLAGAFQRSVDDCINRRLIDATLVVDGLAPEMHPIVRDEIYRIGYEAIRNASAHSGGSILKVKLCYSQDLTLTVEDNGKGIEPDISTHGKAGHFGLRGMRERAKRVGGKFTLSSSPDSGTRIELVVPGSIIFLGKRPKWRAFVAKIRNILNLTDRNTDLG